MGTGQSGECHRISCMFSSVAYEPFPLKVFVLIHNLSPKKEKKVGGGSPNLSCLSAFSVFSPVFAFVSERNVIYRQVLLIGLVKSSDCVHLTRSIVM